MKRRSNGEGSFRKLPSGNWSGQIMVGYTPDGKRKIKTFTAPTKPEVREKMRQYLDGLVNDAKSSTAIPFSEWADTWYADMRTQVEASTYWNYSFTLKKLKAYFSNRPIHEIKQLDINHFIDTLLDMGLSKSTISKCKSMLVQIFTAADDNGLIQKNPALRTKSVKKLAKHHVYEKNAFTEEEIKLLIAELPNDLLGNSIRTLIGTGMRVQELLALTKDDISEDGALISVNKAVKMVYREPQLGSTKSEKSSRAIPVPKKYRSYVLYLREHGGDRYIWTTTKRDNGLYTVEEFRNRYKTAMKKIPGVPYYAPHCCRHTYVTTLQAKQVPMDIISALAGHKSTTTTQEYTHITTDTLKNIIESLD